MEFNGFERWFAKAQFGFEARTKFYQELAALLRSGMSKPDAVSLLQVVASDEGKKQKDAMAIVLSSMLRDMRNGRSFGEAVRRWVPSDDRMVLEATENSDDFPGQLEEYCRTLKQKRKIVGTIVGGLSYPVFLVLMVTGLLIYFGLYIVPDIGKLLPPEKWTGAARFLAFLGDFATNYAVPTIIFITVLLTIVMITLPRWTGRVRRFFDYFPIYALYRVYTGISFILAISSLMRGGMAPINAVERIMPLATPYVKEKLFAIRRGMLNGQDFGEALHSNGRTWPDYNMNLSVKIFARTQDLSRQLARLAQDWLNLNQEKIEQRMATARNISLVAVFLVIIAIVAGMYSVQGQIADTVQQ
ncbi:MAG: type II secretion system F family protein [Rhodobacter sp.]|nr:type II secretion system F family protein [Rhodobacter sp.]MCA3492107.1 type II secretion system F family protein [Rhodobacter sp.]MCA3500361.1 type II secretion system F family protein [Rhodobacter sp.]MCA3503290.1 type II secretion system F family protein [Rhodobacter sp.]MCA3517610.1 type II secretion system F family protein [Rhodobacter sp.]